jgi:hypothetical protein
MSAAFALFGCVCDAPDPDEKRASWPAALPQLWEDDWPVCPYCGEGALLLEPLEVLET